MAIERDSRSRSACGRGRARQATACALVAVAVAVMALAGCGGGGGGDEQSSDATINPDLPKAGAERILCKREVNDAADVPLDVSAFVDELIVAAELPTSGPLIDRHVVCDNTGVTSIEVPIEYGDVEPAPGAPPQTAVRASTDFDTRIERAPIISFFAAPVGGSQYPVRPGLGTTIQLSAEGSLSSGTRDPREGKSIVEDCEPTRFRDLDMGAYSGKARMYVNCGDGGRAWVLLAADPVDDSPYFVQVVAQVLDTGDAEALGRALASMSVDTEALERFTLEQQSQVATESEDTTTTTDAATTTTDAA